MSWFKKKDPKEEMRENERALRKVNREMESDRRQLERKEKELENEIKKLAKAGQREACAVLAKQLVHLRKQKTHSLGMSAQLSAIQVQNRNRYSVGKMAEAVGQTTNTMKTINKQLSVEKIGKTMREFTAAQERLGMTDEAINETLDSMLDESGDEEEQEAIVSQVLDEIGIDLNAQLSKIPKLPVSKGDSVAESSSAMTDADIEKMLAQLRS